MKTKNLVITLLDYLINKYQFPDENQDSSIKASSNAAHDFASSVVEDVIDFSDFPKSPVENDSADFPLEEILSQLPDFPPTTTTTTNNNINNSIPETPQSEFPNTFDDFEFD